ncbi:MAG: alpha/beta hydrolase-fold protein [Terriglobia bacterium]
MKQEAGGREADGKRVVNGKAQDRRGTRRGAFRPLLRPLRCFPCLVCFFCFLSAGPFAAAEVLDKSGTFAGRTVPYKVVLPSNYDPAKAYPAVLAFPGGTQTMRTVESAVERFWRDEAARRGYIVVIPATADGWLYFEEDGARIFPEFLDRFLRDYTIQDNKLHVAGNSNGGLSAFHIAASHPQYFWSVTGFPGYIYEPTREQVRALSTLCINMHVGELDKQWREAMEPQAQQFAAQKMKVRITVEPGQGHGIRTLEGEGAKRLFDQFEDARQGCARR